MPSEIKELFTAPEALALKAAFAEYAYKLFIGSKGLSDVFNSQCNKIYLSDDYYSFLKWQNIVFACIGKPNIEFEKRIEMNENKKTIDAYNNLWKILNVKNKQFEQSILNNFLEDQNLRAKQGKPFDIDKCIKVINKSKNKTKI